MANLSGVVQQLQKERDRAQEEVKGLNAALAALTGPESRPSKKATYVISSGPQEDESRAESEVGKENFRHRSAYGEAQAHTVSRRPTEDCCGSTCTVGQGES